ncbi:hypothetical protein [Paraburkholderia youngii]|uniref:Uncharacterized protein n=1 Tax=Paraburkholderia youngii TaxID=2782701 RepID=A0A7W8L5F6_9BURK|nr:hypothetical protein [Paraburkholderia youngii]MBB5400553.1 hypothetical protein [Paraburkholderia youngii]
MERQAKVTQISEAYNWLLTHRPEMLERLRARGPAMQAVLSRADAAGPKEEKEQLLLAEATFLIEVAAETFPVIKSSIGRADQRMVVSHVLALSTKVVTLLSSGATLLILSLSTAIGKAQWTAVISLLASMLALFDGHFNQIGKGKHRLTAEEAVRKLADLDFQLRQAESELKWHIERVVAGKTLVACINKTNVIYADINRLAVPLRTLPAVANRPV